MTGIVTARALGATDRGYLAFIFLLEAIVRQVGSLGLPAATAYFIARDRAGARSVVRAMRAPAVIQLALLVLAQAALLWVFVLGDPQRVWQAGLLTLALVPTMTGQEYALAILQGQGRFRAYNVLRSLPVTGYGAVIVLLFATGSASLITISIAYLVPSIVFVILMLYIASKGLPRTTRSETAPSRRQIFGFGVRGYLTALSPVETFRLDQVAVGLFLAPKALGLYVVALSCTNLPRFIANSVGAIAFPRVAHDQGTSGRRTMWRFTLLITAIAAALIVPLELTVGWLVPFFFGRAFAGAVVVARLLLVGVFFISIRRVLTDGARGIGFPGLGSIAEAGSWIALVPLLLILLPRYGLDGVAAAMAISAAISLAILVVALVRTSDTPVSRRGAVEASRSG